MSEPSRQKALDPMVKKIMADFARLTGLSPAEDSPRRYLWTDAFAVCNFLELYRQTGEEEYMQLALRLVDQVHHHLGRHRLDDPRRGWISGLAEQEGKSHPTAGGLRIGKKLTERGPADAGDEELEWDRDGQYFHYLTQWMHALNRVAWVSGDAAYHAWAVELAKTAHARFTYKPSAWGQKRMYWKMSIDLTYPLVTSMGQHDALDGILTYFGLQAGEGSDGPAGCDLQAEISDMAAICKGINWATDDPLGLGSLLVNALRAARLEMRGQFQSGGMLEAILDSSLPGLAAFAGKNSWRLPARHRLAFRELGLAIGLQAMDGLRELLAAKPRSRSRRASLAARMEELGRYAPFSEIIERFWLDEANQQAESWTAHREINMVMLATSLGPDGYLGS